MIADRLERLAGGLVIVADDEQLGRLADLRAIALGRDAFGLARLSHSARPSAFAASFSSAGILAGPAHRIAQRARSPRCRVRRARGAREVHAHRAVGSPASA